MTHSDDGSCYEYNKDNEMAADVLDGIHFAADAIALVGGAALGLQGLHQFQVKHGSVKGGITAAKESVKDRLARLFKKPSWSKSAEVVAESGTKGIEGGSGSVNEKIIPPKQINGGTFDVEVPEAKFIGDSPVSGSHNATVKIIDADGEVTKVWREVSGNATESEMALGTGKMRQATHTEQRALTRIELTDETILITGQNPPCKNCQGAMRLKTLNNNGTIIYQWRPAMKSQA